MPPLLPRLSSRDFKEDLPNILRLQQQDIKAQEATGLKAGPSTAPSPAPSASNPGETRASILAGFPDCPASWISLAERELNWDQPARHQLIEQGELGWPDIGPRRWFRAESAPPAGVRPLSSQRDTGVWCAASAARPHGSSLHRLPFNNHLPRLPFQDCGQDLPASGSLRLP